MEAITAQMVVLNKEATDLGQKIENLYAVKRKAEADERDSGADREAGGKREGADQRQEDLEKQLQGGMQQPAFPIILQCPIPHSF